MEIKKKTIYFGFAALSFSIIVLAMTMSFSTTIEEVICRLFTCALFLACIMKGFREPVILNPYWLFALTPLSLLLYSEKFSWYYLRPLSIEIWTLGIFNMIAFIVALDLTGTKKVEKSIATINNEARIMNTHGLILIAIASIPRISSAFFHVSFLGAVLPFCSYIVVVIALKSKSKRLGFVLLIYYLTWYMRSFNKTIFLQLCFALIIGCEKFIYTSKQQKRRLILIVLGLAIVMFGFAFPLKDYMASGGDLIGFITGKEVAADPNFNGYGNRIDFDMLKELAMPYMYLVSSWNNLQYVLETQSSCTYGLWFIKPILGYVGMDTVFESVYRLVPYSSFNTFGYITVLFKDFGYIGSVFGSAFLGFFVKRVYARCKYGESAIWSGCYAMTACAVMEMFFSNHFFMLSYPFTVWLMMWLYQKAFKEVRGC